MPETTTLAQFLAEKLSGSATVLGNDFPSGSEQIQVEFMADFDLSKLVRLIKSYFTDKGFEIEDSDGCPNIWIKKDRLNVFGCYWTYQPELKDGFVLIGVQRVNYDRD